MDGSGAGTDVEPGHATAVAVADEAGRVLQRLERIEALDRERAPAAELLGELRALVHEAEAWARAHALGDAERPLAGTGAAGAAAAGATATPEHGR
jgi:hypothetical protein